MAVLDFFTENPIILGLTFIFVIFLFLLLFLYLGIGASSFKANVIQNLTPG